LVGNLLNQARKFVGGVTGQTAAAAVVQPEPRKQQTFDDLFK